MTQAVFTKLPDRAFITVSGADRFAFLQGLITQDIDLLKSQDLIYSCLLTPNGKFLFDFFIFADGDALVIDCEDGIRATALLQRLSMFKLRSHVTLVLEDNIDVYQIFRHCEEQSDEAIQSDDYNENSGLPQSLSLLRNDDLKKDPRFDGYRAYSRPEALNKVDFNVWDEYRIRAEIPDGSRDMIPEKSFLHESQIIIDTAVSMAKGCYMGQELVSRMHHRGLVKKQLRFVEVNSIPEGAELRSQCENIGLALINL